jgi:polyisoprenoid-binding protein YceI
MTNPTPTPRHPLAPISAGTWRLDPQRTTITTKVKAMYGLFTVTGTFALRDGQVTVAEDPTRSSVQATIDAASYSSGNDTRDKDVISPILLSTSTYPEITFSSTAVRRAGTGWLLEGTLAVHGTVVPIELHLGEVQVANNTASVRATARLDRTTVGVTGKKGMVGRTVRIRIDAVGTPA